METSSLYKRFRDWFIGTPYAQACRPKDVENNRKTYWRRPGEKQPVPGYREGDKLMDVTFVGGIAPGWKLGIHHHQATDPMDLHNHGGRMLSLVLWGGYLEERINARTEDQPRFIWRGPFRFNYIPTDGFHAVRDMPMGHCWTLCFDWPAVQRVSYWVEGQVKNLGRYYGEGLDKNINRERFRNGIADIYV